MTSRSLPFALSFLIHFAILGGAGYFLLQPPQFAINTGRSSVEVNLVAAAPEPIQSPAPLPLPEPVEPRPPKPDDVAIPSPPPAPFVPPPPEKIPVQTPSVTPPRPSPTKPLKPTLAKGDGSAPQPGKDATTASSEEGAILEAKPAYLSNPPPEYPEVSRQSKQEGVVTLAVIVSAQGQAESISLKSSSGFSLLDQAALAAVKQWRFAPATLGKMQVKSRVVIPIRFRLDN